MFDFLSPLFLWAMVAAGIPLFLHLMQKRRIIRVPFSTLHFLKLAQKRSSRRIRLEHFFLWLLRTLTILALAAAFAMPMLRTRHLGGLFGSAQRDVAIVIDGSFSMSYRLGRDTVWDRAVETAVALVDDLHEGDRVCVFMAADTVRPIVEKLTSDRKLIATRILGVAPQPTVSTLEAAVRTAYEALKEQSGRRERELHVITDGQVTAWTGMLPGPEGDGRVLDPDDDRTACFVTVLGSDTPQNAAPLDVETQPRLVTSGTAARVTVRLTHTGEKTGTIVTLRVDGEELARRAVDGAEEAAGGISLGIPPLSAGPHEVVVATPDDKLTLDDEFHLLLHVKTKLSCLCAGTVEDTFYLMKALNAGVWSTSAIEARRVDADKIADERLDDQAAVFLCNAFPLSGPAALRLDAYVNGGGLLVVLPGSRAVASDYGALACLPAATPPTVLMAGMRQRTLRFEAVRHPVVDGLKTGVGTLPVVTVNRVMQWSDPPDRGVTLMTAGAGTAFLQEHRHGQGAAMCLAVSAERSWSSFPLSPFYLPTMHQLVRYGAGIVSDAVSFDTSRRLTLTDVLPSAADLDSLVTPSGKLLRVRHDSSGGAAIAYVEDLLEPGIYRAPGSGTARGTPILAVNVDRAESDLTPLARDRVPQLAGEDGTAVVADKEDLLRVVKGHRLGQTFGEQVLWLALLLGVAEVALANRLARTSAPLSETLKVDATGRVLKRR